MLCSCTQRGTPRGFQGSPEAIQLQSAPALMHGEWCNDSFMVLAMIDGQGPFRLLLDTGAAVSVLDDDAAARLGSRVTSASIPVTGGGGTAVPVAGQSRIGRLDTGAVSLLEFDVIVQDLSKFEPILGPLDGVLGYSALAGTTFTIDYPGRAVTIQNEGLDPDARRGDEAWFEYGSRRPHITANVAGHRVRMLVDSGSGAGFDLKDFDDLPRSGDDRPVSAVPNLDRVVFNRAARLDGEIQLGPIVYDSPAIGTSSLGSKIGTRVMAKFRWTFDTRAGVLRIDRGPVRVESKPVMNLGYVGHKQADGIVVTHIAQESAARANGLLEGDRVVAINGVSVASCPCECMRHAYDRATPVVLSVDRDGQRISIEAPPFTVIP